MCRFPHCRWELVLAVAKGGGCHDVWGNRVIIVTNHLVWEQLRTQLWWHGLLEKAEIASTPAAANAMDHEWDRVRNNNAWDENNHVIGQTSDMKQRREDLMYTWDISVVSV